MQSKGQRIRDPLHDLIEFNCDPFESLLWSVVQTPSFQRLRRIKQLGFSEYVYPGATHTRFSHSLGAYHLAKDLLRVIQLRSTRDQFDETLAQQAIAAALVHDVGHGPFSHAFEDVGHKLNLKLAKHEDVSYEIIRNHDVGRILDQRHPGFSATVADLVRAKAPSKIYGAVVSSQFDADRLDYMQRDRLMTGTGLGRIDLAWLLANLEIGNLAWGVGDEQVGESPTFVLGTKSIHAAEAYVLGLFQLYPTVYYHKATRGAEKIFTEILLRIFTLVQDACKNHKQTNLPKNHPLIAFAKKPESLENALRLDDTVIMGALSLLAEAKDPLIQDFAGRLQQRRLYKCIDVRERLLHGRVKGKDKDADERSEKETALSVEAIRLKIQEWLQIKQDSDHQPGRILLDEGKREPYKLTEEEKGPLNQIRIKTLDGKIVDINEQSAIIRAIRPFEFFRVYMDAEDDEARTFIEDAITVARQGAEHGTKTEK